MAQLCHCHDQEEENKLSPAAERKLVKMVKSQPKNTKKRVCNKFVAAGRLVTASTLCFASS